MKIFVVSLLLICIIAGIGTAMATPSIWTDKLDYSPEEIVIISGSGFTSDSQIALTITRPDNFVDQNNVIVDEQGNFIYNYQLDGIAGSYLVKALDSANNILAETTFTDTNTRITFYEPLGIDLTYGSFVNIKIKLEYKQGTSWLGLGSKNVRLWFGESNNAHQYNDYTNIVVTTNNEGFAETNSLQVPAPNIENKIKLHAYFEQIGTYSPDHEIEIFSVTDFPPVPELSPLILSSVGILGLVLISRRYKK